VVAVCGSSPEAVNAAWRAALVAKELGAALHLLYPTSPDDSPAQLESRLRALVGDLREQAVPDVTAQVVTGNVLRHAVAASQDAAMLVLASPRRNPLREWVLGTPAERLIRLCRSCVLVVKRPAAAPYRRVLVAVEIDGEAERLVRLATSLTRAAATEVLHVLSVADEELLREMGHGEAGLRNVRQYRSQRAYLAVHQLLGSSGVLDAQARLGIAFGAVPDAVLARAAAGGAELVVVGKRQRGLLADWFLGNATQRILARGSTDVLVQFAATRAAANDCASLARGAPPSASSAASTVGPTPRHPEPLAAAQIGVRS
jgi:nucleotide-binding universal stress UspA family protein